MEKQQFPFWKLCRR